MGAIAVMSSSHNAYIQRRYVKASTTGGFTLYEVLIAGFVLVVGLIFIAQFFASAVSRTLDSETRSLLHQVATEELENIRALPYEDVGTVGGNPPGTLAPREERTVDGTVLEIIREVVYIQDSSYSGPYPANYRRVTVRVGVLGDSRLEPVELTSNMAGGAGGGALDVTVTDTKGIPVPDARIVVRNDHLSPAVLVDSSAIRTDSQGHILIPGLRPDTTAAYVVTAGKTGYNSDWTDPAVIVQDGIPYTYVQLIIDLLSTLNIQVVDGSGAAVPNLTLSVTGPRGFSQSVTTDSAGKVFFVDIGYSTDLDPYIVLVNPGQGYDPASASVTLDPGQTLDIVLTVTSTGAPTTTTTTAATTTTTAPGATTTTTAPTTTTTTTAATTTTTLPTSGSLTIRVLKPNGDPLKDAEVKLQGVGGTKKTNDEGYVTFTDLPVGTYAFEIKRKGYDDYTGTVTINGAVYLEVTMVKN
ncbi:MAG: carboxypeptidase regulatory-like domain-containing protein [Thermoleophilia bacterium]